MVSNTLLSHSNGSESKIDIKSASTLKKPKIKYLKFSPLMYVRYPFLGSRGNWGGLLKYLVGKNFTSLEPFFDFQKIILLSIQIILYYIKLFYSPNAMVVVDRQH